MRRHAYGSLASGAVLFAASAIGMVGTWAVVTAVLVLTIGALMLAIAMEDATAPTYATAPNALRAHGPEPDLAG